MQKVVAKENVKKLAVIYDQTQDAQAGDAEVCKELAGKLGYEIVAFEAFRAGDQDFSPQISKIRSLSPDAIYVAAATGDGIKVVSQIREAGIDKRLITGYGSFQDPVYWDGTKGSRQGRLYLARSGSLVAHRRSSRASWTSTTPASRSRKRRRSRPSATTASRRWWRRSRRPARPTATSSPPTLAALDFTTPLGSRITFKNPPDGNNINPSVVTVQVNGRGTYVAV